MTRFADEISELPEALGRLVASCRGEGRGALDGWAAAAARSSDILFAGMGTSEFAPLAVRARLVRAGVSVRTIDAGEWLHYGAARPAGAGGGEGTAGAATVLVSQSGESVEIRRIIDEGLAGDGFAAITNDPGSTLARAASHVLLLHAGDEASISTKTYTNTLAAVHLMAAALEGARGGRRAAVDAALDELDAAAGRLLGFDESEITRAAEHMLPGDAVAFVGRGPANVSARQCALTYMEGAKCLATPFTGGAFRHGPFELAGPELRAVFFLSEGPTRGITEAMAREAAELGGRVVLITDAEISGGGNVAVVRVPAGSGEEIFPLGASGTHAKLLQEFAAARGVEAGIFRHGSKVTSKE